ncbi:MAG: hypothetical protein LBG97_06050 [Coriobacteriales bacterium]|jgi:hypothetical protein|nr:hypothetical protein [Coriobacteriales bacterium]
MKVVLKGICRMLVAAAMCFTLFATAGCGAQEELGNAVNSVTEAVGQLLTGDVTGEVGKDYRTQWFTFNIKSVTEVSSYAGIEPEEGNTLIDVVIYEKNIFEEAIPMGTFDFWMEAPTFDRPVYPLDPEDSTMMPLEFDLETSESVTYHMVYEVPKNTADLVLKFTEVDVDSREGATFTIKVNL